MSNIREVIRILFNGGDLSYRSIGKVVGLSHNTVGRYDRIRKDKQVTMQDFEDMDDNALEAIFSARPTSISTQKTLPDFEYLHEQLKIRGVTLEILWQEYRQTYPDGYSYTHCTRLYKRWARKLNITMRQTHRPGEKLFVDYSGKRLPITNRETGEIKMAEVFVAVLGLSNMTYVEASHTQQVPDWLNSNKNALEYFGGVPSIIVPDNLKSAVLQHGNGTIKLNPHYVDFARHYGTVIIPARPKRPKDKAKVEGGVRIAQTWILAKLRNHVFFSVEEANIEIRKLLEEFNNRPFKKIKGSRQSHFDNIDKPALKVLPVEPYEYADWKIKVRVGLDYKVEYDKCFYMVPHILVDQYVDIRASAKTVEVIFKNRRVASHARLFEEGAFAVERDFMPLAHQKYSEWSPTRLMAWAQSVGDDTVRAFNFLLTNKRHPESGFRTCISLVELAKSYGLSRLDGAASVALQINSVTLSSIRSILRTGRDKSVIKTEQPDAAVPPTLLNVQSNYMHVRGQNYFQ